MVKLLSAIALATILCSHANALIMDGPKGKCGPVSNPYCKR